MVNDTQDDVQPVRIKEAIMEMFEEVKSKGANNLKAQIRELIDEIEYMDRKGYRAKHIVEFLQRRGIEINARQLSQALYQVRQEIKREEERELNGGKKRKTRTKEPAPAHVPAVVAPAAVEEKAPTYMRRPPAAPTIPQSPGFVRTKVTAELRSQMRKEMSKE